MRGRTKLIGFGAVAVMLGFAAAGEWRYQEHVHRQPDWQIHHTAVPAAAKKVDDILAQFERDHIYEAGDYLHSAGQHPDVQVLSVTGQTHWQTGVRLVLKVTGHGVARGFDQVVLQQSDVPICVVARVTGPGEVKLWRPSHTQLAPGELSCSAGLALSGEFNTAPR